MNILKLDLPKVMYLKVHYPLGTIWGYLKDY